jgi:hypothetical protein
MLILRLTEISLSTISVEGAPDATTMIPQVGSTVVITAASSTTALQTDDAKPSSSDGDTNDNHRAIVIAVVVPVIVLGISVIVAYSYKRRTSRTAMEFKDNQIYEESSRAEGDPSGTSPPKQPNIWAEELHNNHTSELAGNREICELPATVIFQEVR